METTDISSPTNSTSIERSPKNLSQVITSAIATPYVSNSYPETKFGANPPTMGFWANAWNITISFIYLYHLFLRTHLQVKPVGGFSCLMAQMTQTRAMMYLLGFFYMTVIIRGQIPQNPIFLRREKAFSSQTCKKFKLSYFRHYGIYCNHVLHDDKDHQVPLVGGLNMSQTDPRWRTAAILKNWKIAIALQQIDEFWRNLARWCIWALRT